MLKFEVHWLPRTKRERRGSFSSEDGIMCEQGEAFVSPQMVSANTHFTPCIGPMKAHSAGFSLSCCSRTQLWTDILFHTPPLELVIAAIRRFSPGNRSTNGMTMLLEDLFKKEFHRTFYSWSNKPWYRQWQMQDIPMGEWTQQGCSCWVPTGRWF